MLCPCHSLRSVLNLVVIAIIYWVFCLRRSAQHFVYLVEFSHTPMWWVLSLTAVGCELLSHLPHSGVPLGLTLCLGSSSPTHFTLMVSDFGHMCCTFFTFCPRTWIPAPRFRILRPAGSASTRAYPRSVRSEGTTGAAAMRDGSWEEMLLCIDLRVENSEGHSIHSSEGPD